MNLQTQMQRKVRIPRESRGVMITFNDLIQSNAGCRQVEGIARYADAFQRRSCRYTFDGERVYDRRDLRGRVYPFVRSCLGHKRVRYIVRIEKHSSGPQQVKL